MKIKPSKWVYSFLLCLFLIIISFSAALNNNMETNESELNNDTLKPNNQTNPNNDTPESTKGTTNLESTNEKYRENKSHNNTTTIKFAKIGAEAGGAARTLTGILGEVIRVTVFPTKIRGDTMGMGLGGIIAGNLWKNFGENAGEIEAKIAGLIVGATVGIVNYGSAGLIIGTPIGGAIGVLF